MILAGDPLNLDWLATVASAWLLNYVIHSTVLLTLVWAVSRRSLVSPGFQDVLWKTALVGGLVTATAAGLGHGPLAGTWTLMAGTPETGAQPLYFAPGMVAAATAQTGTFESWMGTLRSLEWRNLLLGIWVAGAALVGGLVTATAAGLGHGPLAGTWTLMAGTPETGAQPLYFAPGMASAATPPAGTLESWMGTLRSLEWRNLLLGIWVAGAALGLLGVLAARLRLVRTLGHRTEVAPGPLTAALDSLRREAGVRRPVRLTISDRIGAPVALGRAEICLPPRAVRDLDPEQQRNVLAHELAHLVRRDPTWRWVGTLMERLFFFQPLNRLARHGMNDTAEFLCDDWAVRRTGQHVTLARCLLEVAGWLQPRTRPVHLSGMAEPGSPLVRRVERLLSRRPRRDPGSAGPVLAGLALLGGVAMIAPGVTAVRPAPEPLAAVGSGSARFTPPIPVRGETLGLRSPDRGRSFFPETLGEPAPRANTFVFEVPVRRALSGSHLVTFTPEAAEIRYLYRNLEVMGRIDLQLDAAKTRVLLELLEQLSVRPEGDPVPVVPAVEATTFRMEVDVKALRELLRNQQERLREEQSRFRELNREISVRRRVNAPEPGWSVPGWI